MEPTAEELKELEDLGLEYKTDSQLIAESQAVLPEIQPGTFYEDCRYYPILCLVRDDLDGSLTGLCLIDGYVGDCSLFHCGVVPLSFEEAIQRYAAFHGEKEASPYLVNLLKIMKVPLLTQEDITGPE